MLFAVLLYIWALLIAIGSFISSFPRNSSMLPGYLVTSLQRRSSLWSGAAWPGFARPPPALNSARIGV